MSCDKFKQCITNGKNNLPHTNNTIYDEQNIQRQCYDQNNVDIVENFGVNINKKKMRNMFILIVVLLLIFGFLFYKNYNNKQKFLHLELESFISELPDDPLDKLIFLSQQCNTR